MKNTKKKIFFQLNLILEEFLVFQQIFRFSDFQIFLFFRQSVFCFRNTWVCCLIPAGRPNSRMRSLVMILSLITFMWMCGRRRQRAMHRFMRRWAGIVNCWIVFKKNLFLSCFSWDIRDLFKNWICFAAGVPFIPHWFRGNVRRIPKMDVSNPNVGIFAATSWRTSSRPQRYDFVLLIKLRKSLRYQW